MFTCDVLPQLVTISLAQRLYKEVACSLLSLLNVSRESTPLIDCLCFCLCVWDECVWKVPLYLMLNCSDKFLLFATFHALIKIVTPSFVLFWFGSRFVSPLVFISDGQVKPHEALGLSLQLCRKRFKALGLQSYQEQWHLVADWSQGSLWRAGLKHWHSNSLSIPCQQ